MSERKLIVIGGDAAGMTAASKIRREQPEREIIVFERGHHTSYAACGIPYYIAGQVKSEEDLIARKPEVFREKQNIDVRIRHEVIEIDAAKKQVKVKDIEKDEVYSETWDDLLIATGASAVKPDLPGINAKGVFALSSLQSGIDVFNYMKKNNPEKALIVGGGYIGIEMAEALLDRDMDVTLIDMAPQVMTTMDKDMAELILEFMKKEGIKVFPEEKLSGFEKDAEGKIKSVVTDKQNHPADLVILGMGVKPNSELAAAAGVKLGAGNAICVKKDLATSVPHIWAAGDCAESYHLLKKQQVFVPLGTVANKHGQVAGINISGGKAEFPGVLGTAITKFRKLEISRTGLSEREAKELGLDYKSNTIEATTLSSYYPGTGKMSVKLVIEKGTGRILGGQIVGTSGSAKRIDTIATAITGNMTVQNLVDMDLSYAPPFSPVWDPVQIAARTLL
ncbi:MAG: FAD-dependent oxidoreductase [Bacteroidales bacterium]|nr:FAD-dependent oxidoreductase [Bacteroidales bacterium]